MGLWPHRGLFTRLLWFGAWCPLALRLGGLARAPSRPAGSGRSHVLWPAKGARNSHLSSEAIPPLCSLFTDPALECDCVAEVRTYVAGVLVPPLGWGRAIWALQTPPPAEVAMVALPCPRRLAIVVDVGRTLVVVRTNRLHSKVNAHLLSPAFPPLVYSLRQ
jgi:hypothetical protein